MRSFIHKGKFLLILPVFLTITFFTAPAWSQGQRAQAGQRICDAAPTQTVKFVQRFGNPGTALHAPLRGPNAFANLFGEEKYLTSFKEVLRLGCLDQYQDQILSAARSGEVTEVSLPPGTQLQWVGFRKKGNYEVVGPVRWTGKSAFDAYQFKVQLGDQIYTFVVPKACGNFSLMNTEPAPRKAEAAPPPAPAPTPAPPPPPPPASCSITVTTTQSGRCSVLQLESNTPGALQITLDGTALAASDVPPQLSSGTPVTIKVCKPGTYYAHLTADNGAVCEASTQIVSAPSRITPFIAGYVGKERRVREEFDNGGRCAPLVGAEGGIDFQVADRVELSPGIGFAVNTRDTDNSSLFADVALNYRFDKGFIGAGVGAWDLTHSDMRAGSILFQFGIGGDRLQWANQGRLFMNRLDDISNNYMFWSGLRFRFGSH